MKLIIAMVKPHNFPATKKALFEANIRKMTVTNVVGCGQQAGYSETYRGVVHEVNLVKKVRVEIAVNDEFEEATIKAIIKGGRRDRRTRWSSCKRPPCSPGTRDCPDDR